MSDPLLRRAVDTWATDLSATISAFLGEDCDIPVSIVENKIHVGENAGATGISLKVQGQKLLKLTVRFRCVWDTNGEYMAIESSAFEVRAADVREPLFRYEYIREPAGASPGAHLQIHAHRDAFTHALGASGDGSARAKRRSNQCPIADFHFPLGGSRFRPCLEDILECLQDEFGLDCAPGWRGVLKEGRAKWRTIQVGVVTRDAPEQAARVLEELGYTILPPQGPGPLPENRRRLTEL